MIGGPARSLPMPGPPHYCLPSLAVHSRRLKGGSKQGESPMSNAVDNFMSQVAAKNPGEPEFHQAVREVVESIMPIVESTPAYRKAKILDRIAEPQRGI